MDRTVAMDVVRVSHEKDAVWQERQTLQWNGGDTGGSRFICRLMSLCRATQRSHLLSQWKHWIGCGRGSSEAEFPGLVRGESHQVDSGCICRKLRRSFFRVSPAKNEHHLERKLNLFTFCLVFRRQTSLFPQYLPEAEICHVQVPSCSFEKRHNPSKCNCC